MKVVRFSYTDRNSWSSFPDFSSLDSKNTLVLAFCSPMFRDNVEPLNELKSWFPNSVIAGCSTSGEIHGTHIHDLSISVSVLKFENAEIRLEQLKVTSPERSVNAGKKLASQLNSDNLKGLIVLSDGLQVNGSGLALGINSEVNQEKVSISGGLAGDGNFFKSTWVWTGDSPEEGKVVAIGLYGESLEISTSSRGGWDIFGPERTVTKSKGNIVYEIDNKPALDLYKQYLGEKASELPASGLLFPIQIRSGTNSDKKLVRTLLAVSEEDHSMTFAGDLPEGYQAQLMKANFEKVIGAAADAIDEVLSVHEEYNQEEMFSLAVSCVGRRLVLGERAEEELEVLEPLLGENPNVAGFYSYGELGAYENGSPCDLQNQTMTIMTINERLAVSGKKAA